MKRKIIQYFECGSEICSKDDIHVSLLSVLKKRNFVIYFLSNIHKVSDTL